MSQEEKLCKFGFRLKENNFPDFVMKFMDRWIKCFDKQGDSLENKIL
jgi:hypothetical protein